MAFRQLKQLVPEFSKLLFNQLISFDPGWSQQRIADSGCAYIWPLAERAPVDTNTLADDLADALNPMVNNDFNHVHAGSYSYLVKT